MKEDKLPNDVKPQTQDASSAVPKKTSCPAGKSDESKNKGTGRINPLRAGETALRSNTDEASFFDRIYDQIEDVIGGDNPNQFLCLTLPGQALSPEDFAYDYKNNAEKGPTVEANESKLANKLFDPCRVTGADNGMMLPYQYRSALDMLTPQLNAKIAKAKNQLRELLLTPYPYDFGNGDTNTYTLQEVFYRLYDEYVEAEQAWSEEQNRKKEELRKKYPAVSDENNARYNDAYLQWYETVARSKTLLLNEKRSKVLSVFSPNDMEILDGVLDSGSGAELEQARQTLENTQKQTPDGGIIYPVKFNPTNWFELLNSSFVATDLLESPAALSMRLGNLSMRRISLSARISELSALIPDDKEFETLRTAAATAKGDLDAAQNELVQSYGEGVRTVMATVLDVASLFADNNVPSDIVTRLAGGMKFPSGKTMDDLVKDLNDKLKDSLDKQTKFINASQQLSDALKKALEAQNLQNLKSMLSPMQEQLEKVNMQIEEIQSKIKMSAAISKAENGGSGSMQEVTPPAVPEGFTQILIESSASSMNKSSSKQSDSSSSTSGVSFWFAGYSNKKDSSSSTFSEMTASESSTIRIGMNVAKVGIERAWFNPGVFVLTKDMFNVSTVRISPDGNYTEMTDERLKEMSRGYVFPCYPVAMLIARDISIQFSSESSHFSSFAASSEEHASHGGGFLLFSGSKSSSSSSSSSSVHASSSEKSVTIKFTTPQIIGYYLQATPADKSVVLDEISEDEAAAGFVTISQFVEDYKRLLLKMKQKSGE